MTAAKKTDQSVVNEHPRVRDLGAGGQRASRYYARSNDFSKEMIDLQMRLRKRRERYQEIVKFIRWFHKRPAHSSAEIEDRLADHPADIRPLLARYVVFSVRFRVALNVYQNDEGGLELEPVFAPVSDDWLAGQVTESGLVPEPGYGDQDDDVRDSVAIGNQHLNGFLKTAIENRNVRVSYFTIEDRCPGVLRALDDLYDPLSLNYMILDRRLFGQTSHAYLICLIGELSSSEDWKATQSFREALNKMFYQTSSRGRRPNLKTYLRNTAALDRQGDHVDASASDLLGDTPDVKRIHATTESIRRTMKDRARRQKRSAK
jgi:hypothetical protein